MNTPGKQSIDRSPTESIRRAGLNNIYISIFVAGATYYSLTLIAKYFGGSLASDAYFFLVSLSTLASGVIGSLIGTVFLPAFIKLLTYSDRSEAYSFVSSLFSWCLLISCLAAIPIAIWNEDFFSLVSRFQLSEIAQVKQLLAYFAPIFLLSVLSELFRVIALAVGKFSTAAFTALFHPILVIISFFIFGVSIKEEVLVVSLILAKFITLVVLVIVVRREGILIDLKFTKNSHTLVFLKSSAPYWSANVITSGATFYFDYQASGLGTGVVTALAYANRIFLLPLAIFLNPLLEISRTKFAQLQAIGDLSTFNHFYNRLLEFTIFITAPVAAIYFIFSEEIISSMFQRGAFQFEQVKIAATCLATYAWSIPVSALFQINGRACESFQRLLWPSVFGTLGNLLMIAATYLLTEKLGYQGIPLAKVVTDIIYFLPFGFFAFHLFGGRPRYGNIFRTVAESFFAIMSAILFFDIVYPPGYDGAKFSINLLIFLVIGYFSLYSLVLVLISSRTRAKLKVLLMSFPYKFPS